MPTVGDLRVVEFDPDVFEIELFAQHHIEPKLWAKDPFWALPNWIEVGIHEFVGPFATAKEALTEIRIFKNNKDKRLDKYLE